MCDANSWRGDQASKSAVAKGKCRGKHYHKLADGTDVHRDDNGNNFVLEADGSVSVVVMRGGELVRF